MRTNEYVIMNIWTGAGRVWEVRKKGRILWKTIGTFRAERDAERCAAEDMGADGGKWKYVYLDGRRRKGVPHVWALEYHTFVGGQCRKEREVFISGWEARLHRWLYKFDSSISGLKIYRDWQ